MKKSVLLGLGLLVLVIAGGIGYKYYTDNKGSLGQGKALEFAKAERVVLPPVGGYQLKTVDLGEGQVPLIRIPLDTWGGYAALFAANGGLKPSKDSLFYKKGKFAVELVSEESATAQFEGFASGAYPIIWAPMDSLPLLYDAMKADKRVVPKVLGLFDWSTGGDGIVVKSSVKSAADLKGKIILTSSNTAYSFFLLWYLAQSGLSGQDVKVVWIDDGPKALKAFKDDSRIAAWVTWSPFTTEVSDSSSPNFVPGAGLLISSKEANQIIADVYIVRNDLLQDKPEMMQAFVEAMMEGAGLVSANDARTFATMAEFYKLKDSGEAREMLAEVHVANFPESRMFFDDTNPIGAQKIFLLSQEYSKLLGALPPEASYEPERVLALELYAAIGEKGLFANQRNTIKNSFNTKAAFDISDLESQRVVLANDIKLYFEAQQLVFNPESGGQEIKENLRLLAKVAEQMGFLGTTVVKLIGHLDTSRMADFKAQGAQAFIEASAQAKLISKKRAEFVKSLLVERYGIDKSRIVTEGRGWDNPIDDRDPAANRRVEVQFISFE